MTDDSGSTPHPHEGPEPWSRPDVPGNHEGSSDGPQPQQPGGGWSGPYPPGAYPPGQAPPPGWYGYGPPPPRPGIIPLRPLGLGDILDGTVKMIRSNPKATLGLSAIVGVVAALPVAIGEAFY